MRKPSCADCGGELVSITEKVISETGNIMDLTLWFCVVCDAKYIEETEKDG